MQTDALPPRCYEFYFPKLDTLVVVEASPGDVLIRASRDTFSEKRKLFFIHELVAEGFIPEDFAWFPLAGHGLSRGVRWMVDLTWLKQDRSDQAVARRFMVRLLTGAGLLWLGLMSILLLHSAQ